LSAEKRAFVPERRVRDRTWSEKGGLSMGLRKRLEDAAKLVQRQDGTGGTYEFESRDGVEAYVEPKTVMHPLSVVLIAGDGEHRRFTLFDDAYLRELAREHELPIFDAGRVGYPQRMREYTKRKRLRVRVVAVLAVQGLPAVEPAPEP
jgi:hypothetical protein